VVEEKKEGVVVVVEKEKSCEQNVMPM